MNNDGNNRRRRSAPHALEMIMAAYIKKDHPSDSFSDSEQEFDGREVIVATHKGSISGKWSSEGEDSNDDDFDYHNDKNEVSLEAIKKKTIGRDIKSIYDSPAANFDQTENSERSLKKMIMDVTSFTDGKSAANHLRDDLTCPICHIVLYNPVSLLCGHSFCEACLVWWLNELGIQTDAASDADDYSDQDNIIGTCPTCRHALPSRQNGLPLFRVNTALKACLNTLYGAEMNQRRIAEEERKRKATKGEGSGVHQRGNEEIFKLTEEGEADMRNRNERIDEANGWVDQSGYYSSSSNNNNNNCVAKISIRRNIVMDDCDQRYQLSMGMTKCVYSRTATSKVIDLELCLIAMEEDEVETGGFPIIIIDGSDDEALICVSNDRVHTCIQSSAILIPALEREKTPAFGASSNEKDKIKEVILSRGMISRDGNVRFRIDLKKVLDNAIVEDSTQQQLELVKLRFTHVDTKTVLELRLPRDNGDKTECKIEFVVAENKTDASRFMLDNSYDDDDEQEYGPNEYEDDGFVVDDSDVDSDDDDDEEEANDKCELCHNGGDLLVCDGGDNEGGCGKSYHVECINRGAVPPGDWICKTCATKLEIVTGIEGHEWKLKEDVKADTVESASDDDDNFLASLQDSDDEEVLVRGKKRRKVLKIDSDDD